MALYAAGLFYLSSLSAPKIPIVHWSDKPLHFCAYAGLGWLVARALQPYNSSWHAFKIVIAGLLGATLYGITDEFHQLFVPGRTADVFDLAMDALGGLAGGLFYLLTEYVSDFFDKRKAH